MSLCPLKDANETATQGQPTPGKTLGSPTAFTTMLGLASSTRTRSTCPDAALTINAVMSSAHKGFFRPRESTGAGMDVVSSDHIWRSLSKSRMMSSLKLTFTPGTLNRICISSASPPCAVLLSCLSTASTTVQRPLEVGANVRGSARSMLKMRRRASTCLVGLIPPERAASSAACP